MKDNTILLSHGSGGRMSRDLIRDLFMKHFGGEILTAETDAAVLDLPAGGTVFTTDSYVVNPLFFPGGDIGRLAVCGTVNDLSVSGGRPVALSAAFILEEGLSLEVLERVVVSMAEAAREAGVAIVTGDTKVVERGGCDQLFINTAGVGVLDAAHREIGFGSRVQAGDRVIVNGSLGDHGVAVLAAREKLEIAATVVSDAAPLNGMIQTVLEKGIDVRFMRDPTRGGVATLLCELAEQTSLGIDLREQELPVRAEVKNICEVFGFDPLYLANEGKVVMVVPQEEAERTVTLLRSLPYGHGACIIGTITHDHPQRVVMETEIGGRRIVEMLAGEQLPRIC